MLSRERLTTVRAAVVQLEPRKNAALMEQMLTIQRNDQIRLIEVIGADWTIGKLFADQNIFVRLFFQLFDIAFVCRTIRRVVIDVEQIKCAQNVPYRLYAV